MPKFDNTTESIEALMSMMGKNGIDKLSYTCEQFELKLEKNMPVSMPVSVAAAPPVQKPAEKTETVPAAEKEAALGNIVKSPIVGTYYNSPAPEKPPFVTLGKKVKKGDVLMIIESMKLMNEIQSNFEGTIAEMYVKNGTAVEYDQPIMRIEQEKI